MGRSYGSRRMLAIAAVFAFAVVAAFVGARAARNEGAGAITPMQKLAQGDLELNAQGQPYGGAGGESKEYLTALQQFSEARTAPSGVVNPGAYTAALASLNSLPVAGTTWSDVTKVQYDADDADYRDYYSNSSGGSGNVTGRITGLAADDNGAVYVASAMGGVWRSTTGGGKWTPIADQLPSLSSGDLQLVRGALWYATGEANTGGTSYVGSGVYRLANPTTALFAPANRVGGDELESTTINALRFSDGRVWAATLRGIWFMDLNADGSPASAHWTLAYAPNPSNLPTALKTYTIAGSALAGATFGTDLKGNSNAAYKNIVNDLAVDPRNASHVLAAVGWRSGDVYNGFYETTDAGKSWTKINPTGGLDATDIGNVSFAFSADGKKLYAINQSPRKLNSFGAIPNTFLDGVYVSNTGALAGPWTRIASSEQLGSTATGSALYANFGLGYSPGIQAWYNQFILVDPNDAKGNHVYVGLEEVYETTNGGNTWNTVGPYWNFYFGCWAPDAEYNSETGVGNRCPLTTHSDQHSIAVGTYNGKKYVYVGNDGGVYRRPLDGQVNRNGNATDWNSLNDGTIDALQYYAVDVGKLSAEDAARPEIAGNPATDVLVSGGLQDNGGSLLRPGAAKMVSNFGGDGGDVLVDPNDGCNIVQEYVVLSMSVTQTCANPGPDHPNAFLDLSQTTTFKIGPPDVNARFIAPFVANSSNIKEWLAGGNSLWVQSKGFEIRKGSEWTRAYDLPGSTPVYTALAMSGDKAIGAWCGPCNNQGFARGITVGTRTGTTWTFNDVTVSSDPAKSNYLPLRYIGGVAIDKDGNLLVAVNGFSRRFTEGEGAGVGHVFESTDNGVTWTDISANFPDIPANSIQALADGSLVVGTDLAVLYRAPGATSWKRLGSNLPLTVALDVELGPDGNIYAATHGRGIWRIAKP